MKLPPIFTYVFPLLLVAVGIAADLVTSKPSTIRTELEFDNSLRPQDEQEISVTGTNGSLVNIIVQKHDPNKASTWIPKSAIVHNSSRQFVDSVSVNFDKNADRVSQKLKREIDTEEIPVIEGVRMPDDDEDKVKTWRNGRVIDGVLIPYEKDYVPEKVVELDGDIGQSLYVKSFNDESNGDASGKFHEEREID